ncbi:cell division protein SepF [Paenibacillus polysaccharolyticus]|jgi:cell division inhibitor SepF|uniref:Cell division protein SepF n=4 Tax=Paenibacillus TaxID=44249 RepID=A0A5M9WM38_PAEAM|nr:MULTISPECIES: cell division protein SepF [Paenibacillus]MDP9699448.1 cell division inhibitor SepF [Paenibacillus intestini]KAA8782623.1 cell division protein SepF [Paenibacillus amylolyticus]MBY0204377.1 cell division protein SepF [Paenibacillus cucumis (ex Kampfer et al. 2016)]MCM3133808.1 cell division protein SepF [Paenibacillus polysaccharolyticus]MCP1132704.1 cell division protein SepF [Paenibacillus polysaccharolyticus]
MGVMNKFMNFLGLQEEEEIVERERLAAQEEHEPEQQENETSALDKRRNQRGNNVVSIHSQKNVKVVLYEPRSYDEAQEIADHLRSHRTVVVNLQRIRQDQALRVIDFLSGTVYALGGGISKIGGNIFLCTPDTVEIQGTITEILADSEQDYNRMR